MDMKWEQGDWALGPTGLPETVEGLEELLQNGAMAIAMEQGSLPYDRSLGSRFYLWDREEEHALERAVALANEGLLSLPGVQAVSAQETEDGVVFTLQTPLGEGERDGMESYQGILTRMEEAYRAETGQEVTAVSRPGAAAAGAGGRAVPAGRGAGVAGPPGLPPDGLGGGTGPPRGAAGPAPPGGRPGGGGADLQPVPAPGF